MATTKLVDRLDLAPGWKSAVTGFISAVFNTLASFEVFEATPDQVSSVNALLLSAIVLFIGMKIRRARNGR